VKVATSCNSYIQVVAMQRKVHNCKIIQKQNVSFTAEHYTLFIPHAHERVYVVAHNSIKWR